MTDSALPLPGAHLKFPEFDDIEVSTKTYVVVSNTVLDLEKLFYTLPITPYVPKKKTRGKRVEIGDNGGIGKDESELEEGSIVTLKYKDDLRGVNLKKKVCTVGAKTEKAGLIEEKVGKVGKVDNKEDREELSTTLTTSTSTSTSTTTSTTTSECVDGNVKKKKKNCFRNSVTMVIYAGGKLINMKVSKNKVSNNGMFHITGVKSSLQVESAIKHVFDHIFREAENVEDLYSFSRGDKLEVLFVPAMSNIDFDLTFIVDREKFSFTINMDDNFQCLLETSFGYTGVNIKRPLESDIESLEIKKMIRSGDENEWKDEWTTYKEYLSLLPEKDKKKKLKKDRYNTFLVFHSGKVIMSGITESFMRDEYYNFLGVIRKCYDKIEERLDEVDKDSVGFTDIVV